MTTLENILKEQSDSVITPKLLSLFDYLVPGEWDESLSLERMVAQHTPLTKPADVASMASYAGLQYVKEENAHYRNAMAIYSGVDTIDKVAAGAAFASKVGDAFNIGVIDSITPKPDTTQAIDAGIKLVAEIAAFTLLQGLPSMSLSSIGDFASKLSDHASEDRMRLASWVLFDGLIPLGPDFIDIIGDKVSSAGDSVLQNPLFSRISGFLPDGAGPDLINRSVEGIKGWVGGFVGDNNLTQSGTVNKVKSVLSIADDKFDYVAAAIDLTTNYFEYTGALTVSRKAIQDAYPRWQTQQKVAAKHVAIKQDKKAAKDRKKSEDKLAAKARKAEVKAQKMAKDKHKAKKK